MKRPLSLLLCLLAACGDDGGSPVNPRPDAAEGPPADARNVDAPDSPSADGAPFDSVQPLSDAASPPDAIPPDADPPDAVPPDAPGGNPNLASLAITAPAALAPGFDPAITAYTLPISPLVQEFRLTATSEDPAASIRISGAPAASGTATDTIVPALGQTVIPIEVQAPQGLAQTYDLTVDRSVGVAQSAYGKASNTGGGDQLGWSISLSGDTLVVGAPFEDSAATGIDGNGADNTASGAGAVYVYRRSGTAWAQEAYLKASNTAAGDNFGWSVAISGDTIAVGAPFEDSSATGVNGDQTSNGTSNSGAVYVFRRTGTTWAQEAYVKASNPGVDDNFGHSVSVSGDTLAVGAYREDSNATGIGGNQADNSAASAGAAYVFRRTDTTWAQEAYVKASNTGAGDELGFSITVSGDILAVAGRREDSSATGVNGNQADEGAGASGAVYVFVRNGATWAQEAYVKASNTGAGDEFGTSVALSGNVLAVGAPYEDSAATGVNGNGADNTVSSSGAVYVFRRSGTTWAQDVYLKASNTGASDAFGYSVSVVGEILATGALAEASNATGTNGDQTNNGAVGSGAAYAFHYNGSSWSQVAYIKASNTNANDSFGFSIAAGRDGVAVGATGEASNATGTNGNGADNSVLFAGAAYILH